MAAAASVTLVGLSWVGVALAALFLNLTTKQWILAVAAAVLVTEVALYVGAVFLGVTLFPRIRASLRLRRHS